MAAALVTGASSGIGRDIALLLSEQGYDIILVSRNGAALQKVAKKIKTRCIIIPADLSEFENCHKVYEQTKGLDVEILVNNAGYGVFGRFTEADLPSQLSMLDLNISATHILTYLFLRDFKRKNRGYILNVSSLASYAPGPLLAAYYGSKTYIYRLSTAIAYELKTEGSNVHISVLCPGPTKTNFNRRAGVAFSVKPMPSKKVAACAVKGMFAGKMIIIPGFINKMAAFLSRFVPLSLSMKVCYNIQNNKIKQHEHSYKIE